MTAPNHNHPLHVQHHQIWRRAVLMILLVAGLAGLASSDAIHVALINLVTAVESVLIHSPVWGATLFIVLAALSAMIAFVSVAAFVSVLVYTWGAFFSIVLLWIGWILGGLCAYTVGRYLGRPAVAWLSPNHDLLHKLESRISPDTPIGVIVLFQLGLPSEIPGYVLGLARYSLPKYLLSLGLAELPYTIATVILGKSFLERRTAVLLIAGITMVCLSVGVFYLMRKKFTESHS